MLRHALKLFLVGSLGFFLVYASGCQQSQPLAATAPAQAEKTSATPAEPQSATIVFP